MKASLETLVSLAKRRGFVFPASEIYGGISGFYDWGPYGSEVVRNLRNLWWRDFVHRTPNIYGLDSAIIQHPRLWEASGHLETFHDPLVECKNCHQRFRADQLEGDKCPHCGKSKTFTLVRNFNLMFKTSVGSVEDDKSVAYLRPETAGAIFAQYENVLNSTRVKLPFGIAQIGKAFRNEISPRDFIFRVREFEQLEIEYFVAPNQANKEFANCRQLCWYWLKSVGLSEANLKWHRHPKDERAHYAADSYDIRYRFPTGSEELWGIANRTDYDLKHHAQASGKDLSYFDQTNDRKFIPYVIEPSLGMERLFLALLSEAYHEESVKGEKRVVLKFKPEIAPVKVAILPLSKDAKLSPLAVKVYDQLKDNLVCEFDETQSIGRRYRRQDEIGTPYCVTIDFESLEDKAVTIRERDSMKQQRVKIEKLTDTLGAKLGN